MISVLVEVYCDGCGGSAGVSEHERPTTQGDARAAARAIGWTSDASHRGDYCPPCARDRAYRASLARVRAAAAKRQRTPGWRR